MLLHCRTDNGKWALPGGSIEIDETADQAIVREVKEETGYEVRVLRLVGIYSDPRHTTVTYVSLAFACAVTGGTVALSDESSAVDWFPPTALPEPIITGHPPRIRDALARKEAAFYR